jgi:nucleoside-diphosphate-sugar epimerase
VRAKSNIAVLVTGATGFVGRHVVRRLVLAGREVVILARSCPGITATDRVARIFGDLRERLKILEGDLTYPCAIRNNLTRLRSNVGTVIHCAGEVRFNQGEELAARAVQIDGPLALLGMLRARGLRCWASVSTAFVCGRRSGVVYENESDMGQEFHNPYERSKLEAEILISQACRQLGVECRVFRPSIVIGAAPCTGGGMPSNLFFAFLRLLIVLARNAGVGPARLRIQGRPGARFNIVPVEYLATAIEQLIDDPGASGRTFHLVVSTPPAQEDLLEMMSARLGLYGMRILESGEPLRNPSPLELRVARMLLPYREYLQQDVRFDDSGARRLLARCGVRPPVIDDTEVDRFVQLAWSSSLSDDGWFKASKGWTANFAAGPER